MGKGDWHAVQAQVWSESMTELLAYGKLLSGAESRKHSSHWNKVIRSG